MDRQETSHPVRPGRNGWAAFVAIVCIVAGGCGSCGPDRAGVMDDLRDESPDVRAGGLRRLGKVARDEDYLLFAKASSDPVAAVRLAAIEVLGARRDPRAVELAAGLLGDPDPAVQEAAAECLGRLPSPKARPYLVESYGRRGPVARAAIARVLAEAGVGPAEPIRAEARYLRERNEAALAGGTLAERVGAAEELGRSGTPAAVERLRRLLGEPTVLVAAAAARGLGAAGERAAGQDLVPLLKSEHRELREAAALTLGTLGDPAAAGPLAIAAREPTPVAIAAAVALARLSDSGPEACSAAVTARAPGPAGVLARHAAKEGASCDLSGLEARVRKGGAEALAAFAAAGPLRVTGLLPLAAKEAEDETAPAELREASIRFLGEAGGPTEAELLTELLARWACQPETVTPPSPAPLQAVLAEEVTPAPASAGEGPAMASGRTDVRLASVVGDPAPAAADVAIRTRLLVTIHALGELRHAPAAPALIGLLAHPDTEIRAGAVGTLGAIGTEEAWAAVARVAIGEDTETVRLAAISLLGERRGPAAAEALVQAAQDGDGRVRSAALRALAATGAKIPPGALEAFARSGLPEAAVALGWLGYDEARPLLLAALRSPAVAGRAELVEALGRLGDRAVGRALADELFHDRPEVRVAACSAAARLGAARSRETVAALAAEDYYVEVRRACERALEELDAR